MVARQNPSPGLASNPGKKITIEPFAGTVTVTANGATIASSTRAKLLDGIALSADRLRSIWRHRLRRA